MSVPGSWREFRVVASVNGALERVDPQLLVEVVLERLASFELLSAVGAQLWW